MISSLKRDAYQSSGFVASGSGILALSSQSSGFLSSGSFISASGMTDGLKLGHLNSVEIIKSVYISAYEGYLSSHDDSSIKITTIR